jgi:hypothetical protein
MWMTGCGTQILYASVIVAIGCLGWRPRRKRAVFTSHMSSRVTPLNSKMMFRMFPPMAHLGIEGSHGPVEWVGAESHAVQLEVVEGVRQDQQVALEPQPPPPERVVDDDAHLTHEHKHVSQWTESQ